jgi:hypothetical protein
MDQRRDAANVGGMNDTSNMSSTPAALTPQQMRELADEYQADVYMDTWGIAGTLRTAADQLEAVGMWLDLQGQHLPGSAIEDLGLILSAGKASDD